MKPARRFHGTPSVAFRPTAQVLAVLFAASDVVANVDLQTMPMYTCLVTSFVLRQLLVLVFPLAVLGCTACITVVRSTVYRVAAPHHPSIAAHATGDAALRAYSLRSRSPTAAARASRRTRRPRPARHGCGMRLSPYRPGYSQSTGRAVQLL